MDGAQGEAAVDPVVSRGWQDGTARISGVTLARTETWPVTGLKSTAAMALVTAQVTSGSNLSHTAYMKYELKTLLEGLGGVPTEV